MDNPLQDRVAAVVLEHGRFSEGLSALRPDADLYALGLTSHAMVAVMLALESVFDVEFPDRLLKRDVFSSVENITRAVAELTGVSASYAEAR
jgi:acyl carrier protein